MQFYQSQVIVLKYKFEYADYNRIGPIGCRALSSCSTLTNLRALELSNNKIKDMGVKALITAKFNDLQDLDLGDNAITI